MSHDGKTVVCMTHEGPCRVLNLEANSDVPLLEKCLTARFSPYGQPTLLALEYHPHRCRLHEVELEGGLSTRSLELTTFQPYAMRVFDVRVLLWSHDTLAVVKYTRPTSEPLHMIWSGKSPVNTKDAVLDTAGTVYVLDHGMNIVAKLGCGGGDWEIVLRRPKSLFCCSRFSSLALTPDDRVMAAALDGQLYPVDMGGKCGTPAGYACTADLAMTLSAGKLYSLASPSQVLRVYEPAPLPTHPA